MCILQNKKHQQKQLESLGRNMGMGVKHYKKDGKEHKGGTHKMPNGQLHSGKTHSKSSVRLYHYGDLSKKAQANARKSWKKK
jgi:hypothetical protein